MEKLNLRDLLERLTMEGALTQVRKPISAQFDAPALISAFGEKPILFHNITGSQFRAVAGLCSTRELIARGIGVEKQKLLFALSNAAAKPKKPEMVERAACQEVVETSVDLDRLPIFTHFAKDGGPYIASAVGVIKDPQSGRNASFHRLMKIGKNRFSVRLVEGRQTHIAYQKMMKKGEELPIAFCIGNSTSVMLGAAISPPPDVDELGIANALGETKLVKCKTVDLEVPAESEFVLEGRLLPEQAKEGPFVDLTETLDIQRQQPVFEVSCITHRRDGIFQALLPGGLEHKNLMGMPREPTIYNAVNGVCDCKHVVITPGGCSWLHAVVQIKKKDESDGKKAIDAAFKGHHSLKHCVVVDEDIDPTDASQVEWAIATRFRADERLYIKEKQPSSSIDPMADKPAGEKATCAKMGLDATIPLGDKEKPRSKFEKLRYKAIVAGDYL